MVKKRQLCYRIGASLVKDMEKLREETGVPISTQIELRLKGYSVNKANPKPPRIVIESNTLLYERWQRFTDNIKVIPDFALTLLLDIWEEAERNYADQNTVIRDCIFLLRNGKNARD